MTPVRVLFVCMGNICRSPMAEAVFQHMVNEAGLSDKIIVDSAGTHGYHVGEHADSRTLDVLHQQNIPYNGRARRFTKADVETFDYVLAMDYENLHGMDRIAGASPKIRLFLSYANEAGLTSQREVPDPYYDGTFQRVYDLVTLGAKALLDDIKRTHL